MLKVTGVQIVCPRHGMFRLCSFVISLFFTNFAA